MDGAQGARSRKGHDVAEPIFNREKFEDVITYICANCDADRLGRTKLNKVLYYFDMVSYALKGAAPTGATYQKQQFGPVAQQLGSTLKKLEADGRIVTGVDDFYGFQKAVYRATGTVTTERMSNEEVGLLEDVIEWVCDRHNARQISEFSHNLAWNAVELGEVMPYRSAFLVLPVDVPDDAVEWAEGEADKVEAWTPKLLDAERLGNLRSRVLSTH